MGLKWQTYKGIFGPSVLDGPIDKLMASETEEELFKALNLEFIPPVMREIQGLTGASGESRDLTSAVSAASCSTTP
jgi:hypothetical protein